jgi:hypothetical protein
MIAHGCVPPLSRGALRGLQTASRHRAFAQVRTGAPPGTRTPNPRIKSPLQRVFDSVSL